MRALHDRVHAMSAFVSLAKALSGFYHLPMISLPLKVQQRILADFIPWQWDKIEPRVRCQIAKQFDYENDPTRKSFRDGLEAITNCGGLFSQAELERLRGDFLPVKPKVRSPRILLPIEWEGQEIAPTQTLETAILEPRTAAGRSSRIPQISRITDAPIRRTKRDLLSPLIERAQKECPNPFDTPSVWTKLSEAAKAKKPPFFGVTESGLQWVDSEDQPKDFTIKNLRERLKRQKIAGS